MFRVRVLLGLLSLLWGGMSFVQLSHAETRPAQIEITLDAQSVLRVNGAVVEIYQLRAAVTLAREQFPDQRVNVRIHPEARVKEWYSLDKTLKHMRLSCEGRYLRDNGERILRDVQECRDWPS